MPQRLFDKKSRLFYIFPVLIWQTLPLFDKMDVLFDKMDSLFDKTDGLFDNRKDDYQIINDWLSVNKMISSCLHRTIIAPSSLLVRFSSLVSDKTAMEKRWKYEGKPKKRELKYPSTHPIICKKSDEK